MESWASWQYSYAYAEDPLNRRLLLREDHKLQTHRPDKAVFRSAFPSDGAPMEPHSQGDLHDKICGSSAYFERMRVNRPPDSRGRASRAIRICAAACSRRGSGNYSDRCL